MYFHEHISRNNPGNLIMDVVPKLVAAFFDSLMFFSKGLLGVSEMRGAVSQGRRTMLVNRLIPLTVGQTLIMSSCNTNRIYRVWTRGVMVFLLLATAGHLRGQDIDDPFDIGAFESAVDSAVKVDSADRLEYLPGVQIAAEASGVSPVAHKGYGAETRLYGKTFLKISKPSLGALFISGNVNYFVFAAASSPYLREFYKAQSPDPSTLDVELSEFHLSFDIKKRVFLRVGTQLISWGATYFWSPADFINREREQASGIEIFDNRSGKPGLRLHIPLEPVNLFLFTDFSEINENSTVRSLANSVSQSWRIDIAVGGIQLGHVGTIHGGEPVKAGFDVTGNVLGADIYGECALNGKKQADAAVVSFSVGGSRNWGEEKSWTTRGEFFYNERGYGNVSISEIGFANVEPFYTGKWYVYGELSSSKIITSKLSALFFTVVNLSDKSLYTNLQFTLSLAAVPDFTVYGAYYGGRDDREFTSLYGGAAVQGGMRIRAEF